MEPGTVIKHEHEDHIQNLKNINFRPVITYTYLHSNVRKTILDISISESVEMYPDDTRRFEVTENAKRTLDKEADGGTIVELRCERTIFCVEGEVSIRRSRR